VAGQIPLHACSQDAVRIVTLASDAQSYRNLLIALGGKEFRIGTLQPVEGSTMHGQVLIYDGDPSGDWSSWAIVFAKVPGYTGSATATLLSSDGESQALPLIEFQEGDGRPGWSPRQT
jgi:hypothetical protein